ncbi:MAG: protein translocase subunit SecF [bacterium]|nr:MAG: protein translocase subunit SecF [bacterium]
MKFFGETHFNFTGSRNRAFVISVVLIVAGLVSLAIRGGPNLSIDFEGGTLIQVLFDRPIQINELRDVVIEAGYGGAEIQRYGQSDQSKSEYEYLIKIEKISESEMVSSRLLEALEASAPGYGWRIVSVEEQPPDYSTRFEGGNLVIVEADSVPAIEELKEQIKEQGVGIVSATQETSTRVAFSLPYLGAEAKAARTLIERLSAYFPDHEIEVRRTETVGPKIGEELKNRAWAAIVISLFGILIYISWRFEFKFAVGAIIALIHDVVITVGIFSMLDKEISLAIIAALLTIVGYSLNDTIVVFDRIRENFGLRRRESYERMINISINESLSRTVITSLTTLIVVLFLLFMGGEVIHDFAFALMVGIIVGTYSSIYVASPILIEWQNRLSSRRRAG